VVDLFTKIKRLAALLLELKQLYSHAARLSVFWVLLKKTDATQFLL